jgi:hypothetical protein
MNNGHFERGDRVVGMLGGVARRGIVLEELPAWGIHGPLHRYSVAFDDGVTCHTMTAPQMEIENPLGALARCGE